MSKLSVLALGPSVLIVDDEPAVLKLLANVLIRQHMRVREAHSGEEALGLMRAEQFGCAIIDKNLPGMDGLELMRQARELQPHCAMIVLTAHASTESAVEALRLGAVDYFEKPLPDLELVGEKVARAIRVKRIEAEREALLEKLRTFEAELSAKEAENSRQRTELEMFNELIERRVGEATQDIRQTLAIYQACLSSRRGVEYVSMLHVDSILEFIRDLEITGSVPAGAVNGLLTRIVRRLEAHQELVRRGQQRVAQQLAAG